MPDVKQPAEYTLSSGSQSGKGECRRWVIKRNKFAFLRLWCTILVSLAADIHSEGQAAWEKFITGISIGKVNTTQSCRAY